MDLSNGVSSNCKHFANDKSLYSVVNDTQSSAVTLPIGNRQLSFSMENDFESWFD